MAIDWTKTQRGLGVVADGLDGDRTWSALLSLVASPKADPAALTAMGRALKAFAIPLAGLDTPRRLAGYIGNTANETGGFTAFSENLSYSAKRMAEVWPGRYSTTGKKGGAPNAKAIRLAGDPVAFANDVYGARMGNERDGTDDNDGFDFRGLGPLGTTGYDNFLAAEKRTGVPFTTQPALMADPGLGTIGALAIWPLFKVNAYYDRGESIKARSILNAGNPSVSAPEGWPVVQRHEAKLLGILR